MTPEIKKPSGQDGFDTTTFSYEDSSISPESFARYLQWDLPSQNEIRSTRNIGSEFPVDSLPDVIKYAVLESVNFNQCPISIAVAVALGALSGSAQAHFDVARDENQISPISLSLITIAESGERKTSTDKPFARVFHEWELQELARYKSDFDSYKNELKAHEILTKRMGSEKGDIHAITNLLNSNPEPKKPIQKTILQDRVSVEKLLSNLADYPIAYFNSNEAGAVLGSYAFKSENFQSTITTLNQLWDGVQIRHDTKSSSLVFIPKPRVTVNLLLQESIYEKFCQGNDGLAFSTGALSRFLVAQPESKIGMRPYKRAPAGIPDIAKFNSLISEFLAKPVTFVDGVLQTKVLPFTNNAMAMWIKFHDEVEHQLGSGGDFYSIRGWGAKAAEQVARIAGNFQVAINPNASQIEEDVVLKAIQVVGYYLGESLKLTGSSKSKDATRVLNWLIKKLSGENQYWIVHYEIQQRIHNDLRDSNRIDEALLELENKGFIQHHLIGKKSYVYLNPHLLVNP
jgi:putative DNA primase/helicase